MATDEELFSDASFERFRRFKDEVGENLSAVNRVGDQLRSFFEWTTYDEAYKLGPKPDLEAFEECAHHLREALAALERVRVSCEGRCTAEYDGHRCEKDNHHEGNHETHEGELLHVWGCVFYTNAEKQG